MKVLLINPPFQRLKRLENYHLPLGLGYLAAAVSDKGFEVRIYDGELPQKEEVMMPMNSVSLLDAHRSFIQALNERNHQAWREVSNILSSYQPDVVGITVLTPLYSCARKITCLCKHFDNRCIVVWGGVHPTLMAEEVLQKEKDVDFVVRGEGEVTFGELVKQLAEGEQAFYRIDGLSYRSDDGIKHNRERDLIQNIDDLPLPRRDLLLNDISYKHSFQHIMGTRGCPYNCAYCSSKQLWKRKVRFRSIPSIIDEIKQLKKRYHITELEFWDDSFTLNPKWVTELCKAMISQKLNLSWWCNTRADLIDEELLIIMKRAGCTAINIGVETGSERTLSYLNRNLSLKDTLEASKLLSKVHMDWYAYFMIGFPCETVEDIEETRRLMHSLSASHITLSIFNPYPRTQLFEICKELGLVAEDHDWSRFSHQSPENHFVKNISKEEFRKIAREMARECDRRNESFRNHIRRLMIRRRYYSRHPVKFLRRLKNLTKLKFCSRLRV
ncbi:MAG: B12-binding domain-containing radical SAM protein [Desulfobacteraceae bacterium]|nr:B12-binding domain-containing radical SAM protein [Desulfobacteraceae bacterium]